MSQDTPREALARQQFEADAAPMGFDLIRQSIAVPEPWAEYADENTGHRWGGWLAAFDRARAAIGAVPAVPVGSILKAHLTDKRATPWCKEILMYSPDNQGDSPENRVMLYVSPPQAPRRTAVSSPASTLTADRARQLLIYARKVDLPERVVDALVAEVGLSTYHPDGDLMPALQTFAQAVKREVLARLPSALASPPQAPQHFAPGGGPVGDHNGEKAAKDRPLLEQALEALELAEGDRLLFRNTNPPLPPIANAIAALREHLATPQGEQQ
jgi:hypothetical protein